MIALYRPSPILRKSFLSGLILAAVASVPLSVAQGSVTREGFAQKLTTPVAAPQTILIGCDAPSGHRCSFALFPADGSAPRRFAAAAGQRFSLPAVRVGADRYIVVVDGDAPARPSCSLFAQKDKLFCKVAITLPGYNN